MAVRQPGEPRAAAFVAVLLLICAGIAAGTQAALGVEHGLIGEYYASLEPDSDPVRSVVTPAISTDHISDDWQGVPPGEFRARWSGFLTVMQPGEYVFETSSDDGSTLSVEGRMVIDNRGRHAVKTERGRVHLDRGPHVIVIDFWQYGDGFAFEWSWARGDAAPTPVPSWLLSPHPVPVWKAMTVRAMALLQVLLLGACAVSASVALWRWRAGAMSFVRTWPKTASLAFFVLFTLLHTWPLGTDPGGLSRNDNSDTMLNEWTIAWVAHQATRAPLSLYDANIFHPNRHTLAYSESMIAQSMMAAPLFWLGASPVLAYNLVLLAGFVLTGWAAYLVAARWTGDQVAGLLSGMLIGVNAHTLTRLPHLQAQHVEFLLLALLALDRFLAEPRMRDAWWVALWFVLQALTSVYLLVLSAFALAAATLSRPQNWWGRRLWPVLWRGALAGGVAAALLLILLAPYWLVRTEQGLTRTLVEDQMDAASLADYLSTPSWIHYNWWSHRWFPGSTALFPGVGALVLAGVAVASGVAFRDPRARMCLAAGVCGVLISFGIHMPGYAALWTLLPPLQAIRAPVRFGYLAIVAIGLLAGFGLAWLRTRLARGRWTATAAVALFLAAAESFTAPMHLMPFDGIPDVYRHLRDVEHAIVVEMPFYHPHEFQRNAIYMLNSTAHWKPLLNGYSGFKPATYDDAYEGLAEFPDARAIATLRARGVTHVVVHFERYPDGMSAILARATALVPVATEGSIVIYRLLPE